MRSVSSILKCGIFALLGFWLASTLCVWAAPTTNSEFKNRIRKEIGKSPASIDLVESLLWISKDWDPSLDLGPLRQSLDRLTEDARVALEKARTPKEQVEKLRDLIHSRWGYDYTEFVDPQGFPRNPAELFLHGLIQNKRGYCMNLSLIYLILADRLNLPLHGVALPNHYFVRYESSEYRINIESTDRGSSLPDNYYRTRFGVPEDALYFMTNLDKQKTLGAYFSNVGLTLFRNRRMEDSLFYMNLSVEINPRSMDALNNLGNIYSELKRYDEAITSYLKALKADPGNASTLFNLGIAYNDAGKPGKALEAFLQVAEIEPGFLPVHRMLVQTYMRQKNFIGALLHLKFLGERQPRDFSTQVNIGTVYLELKLFDLALEHFRKAQRDFPGRLEIDERLAETYYRMEELDKAIVHYEHLIEKIPTLQQIYVQLGWTYYRKGEVSQALEWTERGLKAQEQVTPFTSLAHMNLGFYQVLLKNYKEAEGWYQKAMDADDPKTIDAMVEDLENAAKRFPDRPELYYFAGWISHSGGKAPQAQTFLRKYLSQQSEGELADKARKLLGAKKTTVAPENMIEIPKGFFLMGSDHHGDDEAPEHRVFLGTYYIDKYEVSAAQFAKFINTAENPKKYYADTKRGILTFNGRYETRHGFENYPINNVSWHGADAYCRSLGKRLPTEAEWEKAARGTDGRLFPWGNSPLSPEKARYFQTWTEEQKHKVMVPVDSMPDGRSPYGVFHLMGNVKEWVDDWYDREYYREENHNINPKGQIGGEFKVLKGGSWVDLRSVIYASFRNNSYPDFKMDDYGFRCAFSEGEPSESPPGKMTSRDFRLTRMTVGD